MKPVVVQRREVSHSMRSEPITIPEDGDYQQG